MGETVMASILFTDLVDSTAMAARLGPERTEETRRAHFAVLRAAIEATDGTEVKNLGDGLMVVFANPTRALACASSMQQGIDRHNRRADEPLGIRVGLSAGEAIEDDGDYFGDTVVEAARLCGIADGGQILTTDLVRAMAGRHAAQPFREIGAVELKGIPDPVTAVEVLWDPLDRSSAVPMPAALAAARREAQFGFVGRSAEVATLVDAQKQAFAEPRIHTTLVAGEAGIGKTALTAQTAAAAHDEGTIVLLGHCDEDLTVPYQPWIEALSHLVAHLGTDYVDALPELHRAAIARLLPGVDALDGDRRDAGDAERLVLMHAVVRLLEAVAADDPIVLVLDDLHWADTASLQLLRHIVSSGDDMALAIIGTYRHTDLGTAHPLTTLLADLHRWSNVDRIRLGGLGDADTIALVNAFSGHDLGTSGADLAHALRRETDGNPFFTGELLRHLGESGSLEAVDTGGWTLRTDVASSPLPASIRDVVQRRVAALGSDALRVLSLASVIGREFRLEVLSLVADLSEDHVLDVLEAAAAASVVVERDEPGVFRFGHALTQRTLYEDLAATRRVRTHQKVAEAIEALPHADGNRTAELARHWVAAIRPAEVDRALHYVMTAGEEALAALAPDDAISWFSQALDLAATAEAREPALRGRILVGLGTAQRHIGAEHRATLAEAIALAREADDTDLLVDAILAADRGVAGTSTSDPVWVEATEAALAAVGSDDSIERARLLAILSTVIDAREWKRRQELSTESVAVGRRVGDDGTLLAVLPVAYQCYDPDALDLRLADTAEAIEIAERFGDPVLLCNAYFHGFDASMQAADIATADARLGKLDALVERLGLPYQQWQLLLLLSGRALLDGRTGDAEDHMNTGLRIAVDIELPEATLVYGSQLIEIRRHLGRLAELVPSLDDAAGADMDEATGFRQLFAGVCGDVGDLDKAQTLLEPDIDNGFATIPRDEGWVGVIASCAEVAASIRHESACEQLYDFLLPYERRVGAVYGWITGSPARLLGRLAAALGRSEDARRHFEVALEIHESIPAPYWTARTQLDLRDLLRQRDVTNSDDAKHAAELEAAAHATAAARGYAGLLARSGL